ncbi:general secretion pathway protein GspK [Comamonas sp.]|uniref:general secretion pathway protein GspK n=1 Tax=Comamonas sp. TaxID=34028 RepID=UPI0025892E88|nr:general secretion pathway protein GspK [Comamonas sp.]
MTLASRKQAGSKQAGMALLLVLWVVAGLSIFAASLGRTVRSEAAQATVARHLIEGRAYGEAAVYQVLFQILSTGKQPDRYTLIDTNWQGVPIEVEIVPWTGLINIHGATASLWTLVLEKAAQLPRSQAAQVAEKIIESRKYDESKGAKWESLEDLLQIPGVDYFVFQSIRPYLVAEGSSRQDVSSQASPELLRRWLQEGGLDSARNAPSGILRITAKIPFESSGYAFVERDVLTRPSGFLGQKWKILAAEQFWRTNK